MCDRFFPDEPEYDIEILEWIVEEDYTVEWSVCLQNTVMTA